MARRNSRNQGSLQMAEPPRITFDQKLVLNQWLLSLFEVSSFQKLAEPLKDPGYEGWEEDNLSKYNTILGLRLFQRGELSSDLLRAYDENIVHHWQAITEIRNRQGQRLYPKYFQYLALLFAEIYLDRYFRNPDKLLASLNEQVEKYNAGKPEAQRVKSYESDQLNKLAFWMATGSGKTLLMHINIRQYQHYLNLHNQGRELNRILLLTPNEGLSRQHLEEFRLSAIDAELFSKEGRGLFAGRSIEIIDIHKLREETGEKTVAVEAFEGNNLVLVDEGHRGTSGAEVGHWMKMRNKLCEKGFSFEYSATFGQAIKASSNKNLEQEYARCILFDYSYKYFYQDGYGKDYQILNLQDDSHEEVRKLYLTACLLVFYQQLCLYREHESDFRQYLIDRPLWIFVGGKVTAVRTERGQQVSDVLDILLTLGDFITNRNETIGRIDRLLRGQAGLLDSAEHDIFLNSFGYLISGNQTAESIFDDILAKVFNSATPAALHVELLRGTDGELALKLGDNEPFGVINVGDAPKLHQLCEARQELATSEREFSGSLFHGLSGVDSTINLLIGSKKFSEGWNSWRVSTMGLMNIGRSEGSEIIQLFGRGVRLRGKDFCLKRTPFIEGIDAPRHIEILERLNVFGIRADYMRQFKEFLEEEGLPANERKIEFVLPVISNLGNVKLKIVRLKDGIDFKKDGPKPSLALLDKAKKEQPITLDWYPRIQAKSSQGVRVSPDLAVKREGKLTASHIAFFDNDEIYFSLQHFKAERSWHNINLSKAAIIELLQDINWYNLYIPPEELEFRNFRRFRDWQEIAIALLKKYCEWFYYQKKQEYEAPHVEYRDLTPEDPNMIKEYLFLIEESQREIIDTLQRIKAEIDSNKLADYTFGNLQLLTFGRHLYEPLVYCNSQVVQVKPVALNEGERDFVTALREYYQTEKGFFADKELYLLRNQSCGRGIGFFEANGFHPDFILWLLHADKQRIGFIDPKGIRMMVEGLEHPKIQFYKKIKELETRLGDPKIILSSVILSQTPFGQVSWWNGGMTEDQFSDRNVLFRDGNGKMPILHLLKKILNR